MGIDIQAWRASIGPWHLRGPKWSRRRSKRNGPLSREGVQWRQCILRGSGIICLVLITVYIAAPHLLLLRGGDIEVNPGPSGGAWQGSSEKETNGGLGSWMFKQAKLEEEQREERQRQERAQMEEREARRQQEQAEREAEREKMFQRIRLEEKEWEKDQRKKEEAAEEQRREEARRQERARRQEEEAERAREEEKRRKEEEVHQERERQKEIKRRAEEAEAKKRSKETLPTSSKVSTY